MSTSDLSCVYKWSKFPSLNIGNSYVAILILHESYYKEFSNEFTQKSKCKVCTCSFVWIHYWILQTISWYLRLWTYYIKDYNVGCIHTTLCIESMTECASSLLLLSTCNTPHAHVHVQTIRSNVAVQQSGNSSDGGREWLRRRQIMKS